MVRTGPMEGSRVGSREGLIESPTKGSREGPMGGYREDPRDGSREGPTEGSEPLPPGPPDSKTVRVKPPSRTYRPSGSEPLSPSLVVGFRLPG